VLSGGGNYDKLITRPEQSHRLWYVVVCDLETSQMSRTWPTFGSSATGNNKYLHSVPHHMAFKVSVIHMSYVRTTKYYIIIKNLVVSTEIMTSLNVHACHRSATC